MNLKLPALPTALAEVIQIQRSPSPDHDLLVEVIEKDPALALYVLRQINSAYYGLRKQVSQIDRAVTLLGSKKVCNLVLAAALKQSFPKVKGPTARVVYQHILKNSVATAAFSRDLAEHLLLSSSETAFTVGLLHQIGRLVLLFNASDQYIPLWYTRIPAENKVSLTSPFPQAEQARFKTDYLHLGAMVLQRWSLPEEFSSIIRRLRSLEQVTESPIRILPLIVAIGRSVAEGLFEPEGYGSFASYAINGRLRLLAALAQSRNLNADTLDEFLVDRQEDVKQYTQSLVHLT